MSRDECHHSGTAAFLLLCSGFCFVSGFFSSLLFLPTVLYETPALGRQSYKTHFPWTPPELTFFHHTLKLFNLSNQQTLKHKAHYPSGLHHELDLINTNHSTLPGCYTTHDILPPSDAGLLRCRRQGNQWPSKQESCTVHLHIQAPHLINASESNQRILPTSQGTGRERSRDSMGSSSVSIVCFTLMVVLLTHGPVTPSQK